MSDPVSASGDSGSSPSASASSCSSVGRRRRPRRPRPGRSGTRARTRVGVVVEQVPCGDGRRAALLRDGTARSGTGGRGAHQADASSACGSSHERAFPGGLHLRDPVRPGAHLLQLEPQPPVLRSQGRWRGSGTRSPLRGQPTARACAAAAAQARAASGSRPAASRWWATSACSVHIDHRRQPVVQAGRVAQVGVDGLTQQGVAEARAVPTRRTSSPSAVAASSASSQLGHAEPVQLGAGASGRPATASSSARSRPRQAAGPTRRRTAVRRLAGGPSSPAGDSARVDSTASSGLPSAAATTRSTCVVVEPVQRRGQRRDRPVVDRAPARPR